MKGSIQTTYHWHLQQPIYVFFFNRKINFHFFSGLIIFQIKNIHIKKFMILFSGNRNKTDIHKSKKKKN